MKHHPDPPHHYIQLITPAIHVAARWWARALARCNGLDERQAQLAEALFAEAMLHAWRAGCDRDMCLWEEDMPPVVLTATPTPGFFLLTCLQLIARELHRDLVWRSRAYIEMRINVERVWLRLDGEVEVLWKAKGAK